VFGRSSGFLSGQCKVEGRALFWLRFNPDLPAMAFDDFFANRQANASAGIFPARMQALKELKNAFIVLGFDADAVVPHGKLPNAFFVYRRNMDFRGAVASKFETVAQQVLEKLSQLDAIGKNFRQGVPGDGGLTFLGGDFQILEGGL
jgi:hypothetical protein